MTIPGVGIACPRFTITLPAGRSAARPRAAPSGEGGRRLTRADEEQRFVVVGGAGRK